MSEYKASLIVPCYNVENIETLDNEDVSFERTIDSVKNQTIGFENIELILINNGSTDSTKEILDGLSKEYPNVKIYTIDENTGGPSIPRNIGIKKATSKYVMFLDADDKMDEKCVEILYDEITKHDVDLVKSNYSILEGNQIKKYDSGKNMRLTIKPRSKDMIYLISHFMWGSIYNRKFLIENEIEFPNTQAEDNLFLSKCYNLTQKDIIALNDYYSIIYTSNNQNSLSHSFTLKQVVDYSNIYKVTLDSYIKYNQSKEYINVTIERYTMILIGSLLRSNASDDDKKEMIKCIKKFLIQYENYDLNLAPYWKVFVVLIKKEQTGTILFLSKSILHTFENSLFKKIFRNKDYD